MARKRALREEIARCERRVELREQDVARATSRLTADVRDIRAARSALRDERARLLSLEAKLAKVRENGLKRNFVRPDGLSQIRHIRFRQVLKSEYTLPALLLAGMA